MLRPESDEKSKHIFFVHIELLAQILDEKHIIVLRRVFGKYLGKPHFTGIERNIPISKPIMVEFIVVKGLDEGTHFIEDPYLLLECNPVDVIGKADIFQHL